MLCHVCSKSLKGLLWNKSLIYGAVFLQLHVSGFRKGHDCQGVLIRFSESIKLHLDNNNVTAAVFTNLSKAFGCLPYDLLLSKFYYYRLDETACKLVEPLLQG